MGQIFISAGHGGLENGVTDPGSIVGSVTEAAEMIQIRDLIVPELRSRGFTVLAVPDDLSAAQTINWINARCRPDDVALEIHAGAFNNTAARGGSVFYIANNDTRKSHAELLLLALLRRVPQLPSRGARPDTTTGTGSLAFCRQIGCPSLLMEVGYLTNADDRNLIQTRRREIALGITDGLASWSRAVGADATGVGQAYPEIGISVNGGLYGEPGVIINDNAYIPIDLVDQFSIDVAQIPEVRRVRYRSIVYVKAVDLREFNISVGWDSTSRTLLLRSPVSLRICPGLIDRIMANGNTSEVQLMMFLKSNNDNALNDFPDLPKLYREEATLEGVNYDIAFCQMCVETSFLRFGSGIIAAQNNFGGIGSGSVSSGTNGATFPSARIGVRAQIQHLKAYASTEPLVQEVVDPRFGFVRRGIAPLIGQLSGRWSNDTLYGDKIMAVLRRLYEAAGLL